MSTGSRRGQNLRLKMLARKTRKRRRLICRPEPGSAYESVGVEFIAENGGGPGDKVADGRRPSVTDATELHKP